MTDNDLMNIFQLFIQFYEFSKSLNKNLTLK